MNSNISGAVAEHKAAALFLSKGYEVFWPAGNHTRYDLGVRKAGVFLTVQVKLGQWQKVAGSQRERLTVGVHSGGGGTRKAYSRGDFDLLVVVSPDDQFWFIPYDQLPQTIACITLANRGTYTNSNRAHSNKSYDPDEWLVK